MLSSTQNSSSVSISAAYRNWLYSLLLLMPMDRLLWAFVINMNLAPRILLSSWNYYDSAVIMINDSAQVFVLPITCRDVPREKQCRAKNSSPVKITRNSPVSEGKRVVWVHWSDLCFIHKSLHLLKSVGISLSSPWRVPVHQDHWPQNTKLHCRVLQASPPGSLDHNV